MCSVRDVLESVPIYIERRMRHGVVVSKDPLLGVCVPTRVTFKYSHLGTIRVTTDRYGVTKGSIE